MNRREIEFTVFCVENVAEKTGLTAPQVFNALNDSGLLQEYLIPAYESLHTQSKDYITDEIVAVMRERGLVA